MKRIKQKIWSHLSIEQSKFETHHNSEIRESDAMLVTNYKSLVKNVARISYHNPRYTLFYRGQDLDYRNKLNKTKIYPSIYNVDGDKTLNQNLQTKRFKILNLASDALLREFKKKGIVGHSKMYKFDELSWSVLQHYKVCETPLLDITNSLRVAASFALAGTKDFGYLFILGLPAPNGSISYYVEEELLNIRLLSICPPDALRPYFQEGYLIGTFPSKEEKKQGKHDFGRRLIAKFKLRKRNFWNEDFTPIPENALYPTRDKIRTICDKISLDIKK